MWTVSVSCKSVPTEPSVAENNQCKNSPQSPDFCTMKKTNCAAALDATCEAASAWREKRLYGFNQCEAMSGASAQEPRTDHCK